VSPLKIGSGPEDILEADETKAGKTKPGGGGHGHPVWGVWVLVVVSRLTKHFAAQAVKRRCHHIIGRFFDKYANKDCALNTDMWKGYDEPGKEFKGGHNRVNHKKEFVAPDGTHTNTVEGMNWVLKNAVRRRAWCFNKIGNPLLTWTFKKKHAGRLFEAFWEAAARLIYKDHPDWEKKVLEPVDHPSNMWDCQDPECLCRNTKRRTDADGEEYELLNISDDEEAVTFTMSVERSRRRRQASATNSEVIVKSEGVDTSDLQAGLDADTAIDVDMVS